MHSDRRVRNVGTPLFLVSSMFLSFGALFLWLALPLYEILVRRSLRGFLTTAGVAIGGYVLLDVATGFNWLESLGRAAKQENPHGFSLFSNPGGYLFTRLEGICEILLFASPLLAVAWWRELRGCAEKDELRAASLVGVVTLALMLASGAFKTGETARACLFVYPLLVLPLGRLLTDSARHVVREREALLSSLVLQSLVMQLWGDYYW
jgi:hypothetical protein